jgi:hypothetical protein
MDRLWKCSLTFIVTIAIATAAFAARPPRNILVIADTQHGLALVPEGTPIPRGLSLRVEHDKSDPSVVRRQAMGDDSAPRAEAQPLMLVHAPESAFEAARAAVAKADAAKRHLPGFKPVPNDFFFSVSVYFSDVDTVIEADFDFVSFAYTGAKIYINAGDNNLLMFGSLTGTQSSNLSPDAFADSCYTSFSGGANATCATSYVYASATQATVTTYGRVQGRTYDGCGYGGNYPCNIFHAVTINVTYQWITQSDYSTDYSIE